MEFAIFKDILNPDRTSYLSINQGKDLKHLYLVRKRFLPLKEPGKLLTNGGLSVSISADEYFRKKRKGILQG